MAYLEDREKLRKYLRFAAVHKTAKKKPETADRHVRTKERTGWM